MPTLSVLRANVARTLGLSASDDATVINYYLNEGVRQVLLDTRCYVTSTTITSISTADYTIATSLLDIVKLYWSSGGSDYRTTRVSVDEIIEMRMNSTAAGPTIYYALSGASTLMWFPTPAATDTLTMYYVPYPTELSGDSDDPSSTTLGGIPKEQHKLIEAYALWKVADTVDDETSKYGTVYQQNYEQGVGKFRRDLGKRGGNRLGAIPLPSRRRGERYVPRPDQINA